MPSVCQMHLVANVLAGYTSRRIATSLRNSIKRRFASVRLHVEGMLFAATVKSPWSCAVNHCRHKQQNPSKPGFFFVCKYLFSKAQECTVACNGFAPFSGCSSVAVRTLGKSFYKKAVESLERVLFVLVYNATLLAILVKAR